MAFIILHNFKRFLFRYCHNMLKCKNSWPFSKVIWDELPTDLHKVPICYNTWTGTILKMLEYHVMYKIANENVAIIKQYRLKTPCRQSRNLHSSSFIIPHWKTQSRNKIVFPRTISDWNRMPQPIVLICSIEMFKAAISSMNTGTNLWNL